MCAALPYPVDIIKSGPNEGRMTRHAMATANLIVAELIRKDEWARAKQSAPGGSGQFPQR